MNKKTYILILLTLVLIPAVTATIGEGIDNVLEFIFDATGDIAYLKAGIWLVLFFIIFKSAERIFPANRGAAAMIAIVISVIGSRFMPDEYLEYIGGGYAFLLGFILLLLPYFIGSILGDMLRLGRGGKTVLIILLYAAFAYSLIKWQGFYIGTEALSALSPIFNWMGENTITVLIIIAILCIYFLLKSGRSGVPTTIPSGGEGPSFWRGLGRGAGASSRWAVNTGRGIQGWWARRRAIAMQRAMLKSGWAQKKERLLQQMPKGKVPARGTPGYEEYMKNMMRLDRVRRKLGEEAFLKKMREKRINIR